MPEDRRKLEDAVTLIVAKNPRVVTRTSLVKLLYLADLRSWEHRGASLTGLPWRWHYYGPYADTVTDVVSDMESTDELIVEPNMSYFGTAEYRIRPGENAALYPALSDDEKQVIFNVIEDFGYYNASILAKLTYQTAPMQRVKRRGDPLDFSPYSDSDSKPAPYRSDPTADPSPKMDAQYSV